MEFLKENIISSFLLFENTLNGEHNSSLHKLRLKALSYFKNYGFPTTKDEDWRYTNISPLLKHDYKIGADKPADVDVNNVNKYLLQEIDTYKLVFIDGIFNSWLSSTSWNNYFVVLGGQKIRL